MRLSRIVGPGILPYSRQQNSLAALVAAAEQQQQEQQQHELGQQGPAGQPWQPEPTMQSLQQLDYFSTILENPNDNTPQQKLRIMNMFKANPRLKAAYIEYRNHKRLLSERIIASQAALSAIVAAGQTNLPNHPQHDPHGPQPPHILNLRERLRNEMAQNQTFFPLLADYQQQQHPQAYHEPQLGPQLRQ